MSGYISHSHFRILLVSDIHADFDKLEDLVNWCHRREFNFNILIASGDLVNCQHHKRLQDQQDCEQVTQVLDILRRCCMNLFVLNGNHDPDAVNMEHLVSQAGATFIDGKVLPVNEGLVIGGCGGSIPGLLRELQDGQIETVWNGYPWGHGTVPVGRLGPEGAMALKMADLEMGRHLENTVLAPWKAQETLGDLLLVTHQGPADCSTTDLQVDLSNPKTRTETGSASFREILGRPEFQVSYEDVINQASIGLMRAGSGSFTRTQSPGLEDEMMEEKVKAPSRRSSSGSRRKSLVLLDSSASTHVDSRILLWVHGHSHPCSGMAQLGKVSVVNPGSLQDGKFGVVTLEKEELISRSGIPSTRKGWRIVNVEFHQL